MKAPLRLRPFRRLIAAYAVNSLGTWLGEIALSIFVLHETGSAAALAAVWVAGLVVPSLAGPLLVARLEGARSTVVLPALLAAQAGLFALLAAIAAGGFSLAAILALAAADGLLGLAARALAKASIVATTEPRGLLREGNTVMTSVFTACAAIGPVLGGVVVGFASPEAALLLNATSFALAALVLGPGSGLPRLGCAEAPASGRLREGLAYVRSHSGLRSLLGACGALYLLGAAVLPIEVVLVTDTLGASEAAFGTVLALWGAGAGAGAVAGSALLPALRGVPLRTLIGGSFVVFAVSYLGMGSAGSIELVCLFSLLGGLANGIEAYATMTAIQELTSQDQQVRVGGFFESIIAAATGAGFLLGGAVATLASARAVYIVAGLGILAVTALLLTPRRMPARAAALLQAIPRTAARHRGPRDGAGHNRGPALSPEGHEAATRARRRAEHPRARLRNRQLATGGAGRSARPAPLRA